MVDPVILRALFDREPAEAVAFIESKGHRLTWSWAEMLDEAHARAFTVAKAARMDVLQEIHGAVTDAVREGKTLTQFREELTPRLQEKGWWGKQIVVDSEGRAEQVQLGSPHRLATIYKTNVHSAYMAGRAAAQQQADSFEWLQYIAIIDERTRHDHAALHGLVFHKEDPIWSAIYPPNDFNCRCRVRAMTAAQVRREGVKPESSEGRTETRQVFVGLDKRSGELFPAFQTGLKVKRPDGGETTFWTAPGFNSSPLAGHHMDTILARKAVETLGEEAGFAAASRAVLSEPRLRGWEAFVNNTHAVGRPQRQTMTAGILPHRIARDLADEGKPFAPVIHVDDGVIVGRKARRHALRGEGLDPAAWRDLPARLMDARWYRDSASGNLIAAAGDVQAVIGRTGLAETIYRDPQAAEKIADGRWLPL